MELQRAKVLQHDFDQELCPAARPAAERMVEFSHAIGVPVPTHEIYPAASSAWTTPNTQRHEPRGYSPKMATLQRSYEDVVQLFGKSQRIFCPMIFGEARGNCSRREPDLRRTTRDSSGSRVIQAQSLSSAGRVFGGDPRAAAADGDGYHAAGGLIVRHRHANASTFTAN